MPAAFETPAQYDRDLRSANKEWKRSKDSTSKWSFGSRPLTGCHLDWSTGEVWGGNDDSHRAKARPRGKASDQYGSQNKKLHNINKLTWGNYDMPSGRVRTKINACEEINETSRSITELLLPATSLARQMSNSDSAVLYHFDRSDTPGKPLTLDIFVKQPTSRDTERFVEKEYEILDANGDALKGRKARRTLRKAASADLNNALDGGQPAAEDDDFELV